MFSQKVDFLFLYSKSRLSLNYSRFSLNYLREEQFLIQFLKIDVKSLFNQYFKDLKPINKA